MADGTQYTFSWRPSCVSSQQSPSRSSIFSKAALAGSRVQPPRVTNVSSRIFPSSELRQALQPGPHSASLKVADANKMAVLDGQLAVMVYGVDGVTKARGSLLKLQQTYIMTIVSTTKTSQTTAPSEAHGVPLGREW